MLMPSREIHHLGDFGFRHLKREHTNNRQPLLVHGQHDFKCLRMAQPKETLKHMNHKLHRSVVVVQEEDFIQRRFGRLRFGVRQNDGITVATIRLVGFSHHMQCAGYHAASSRSCSVRHNICESAAVKRV